MMKERWLAPRVEDIQLSKVYAISINPKDEWHSTQAITAWCRKQYAAIRQLVRGCELELYVESSPTGRLHFHGTILILDVIPYLTFIKRLMEYGTFSIKEIQDELANVTQEELDAIEDCDEFPDFKSWDQYCVKQALIFAHLFDHNTVTYPMKFMPLIEEAEPEWKYKDMA